MADKTADTAGEKRRDGDKALEGKKKKSLVMIGAVLGIVLLLGVFFIGQRVSAKSRHAQPARAESGPVLPLDEFLVNLADTGGDHFLKTTINLELYKSKGKTPEGMKDQVPEIRDAILMTLSGKQRDELGPAAGRIKLKAEIKARVNSVLGENDVQEVYFTNFVTQ